MVILSEDHNNINTDMLIFMKMVLKLVFMSDLWLGVINVNDINHAKKI